MNRRLEEDALEWDVGRYTIYGEIASGGMATVHIGRMAGDAGFSRLVAVKRMHPQFARDPDFLAMFLDEARLAARIRHPNVVQTLDVIAEDDDVLLIMEYIHGDALARVERTMSQKSLRIPPRIGSAICAGALHGLHAAHEAKSERGVPLEIIHRDVSPQNILVGADGVARLIDFGIAKAANQLHLTQDGELKGKIVYMAPEQLEAKTVITRQVDIYAMAVTAWEVFCGQRMFETTDTHQIIAARANKQAIEAPSHKVPGLPPGLDAVLMKGLADRCEDRWKTARAMAEALEEAVPPATTSQVATWLQEVAKKTLDERQARVDEIEARGAASKPKQKAAPASGPVEERVLTKDIVVSKPVPPPLRKSATSEAVPKRAPSLASTKESPLVVPSRPPSMAANHEAPARSVPPPTSRQPSAPPRQSVPPPTPRPSRPSASGSLSMNQDTPPHSFAPPLIAAISSDAFAVPELRSTSPSASLEAPAIPTALSKPAKITITKVPSYTGRYVALGILVLAIGAGIVTLPNTLKKNYTEAAAARGITLTMAEVDPFTHLGAVQLRDVSVSSSEIPGASIHFDRVDIDLDGLTPKSLVGTDAEVTLDTSFASLRASLARYSDKHPSSAPFGMDTIAHVRIEPMHIVWSQAIGAGTQIDMRSMVFDMTSTKGRKLGQDWSLKSFAASATTPLGPVGPWIISARRGPDGYVSRVSFDQKAQAVSGIDFTSQDGKTTIDVRAIHATPDELSIKSQAFNAMPDQLRVDLAMHSMLEGDKLDATFEVHAEGWRADQGPSSVMSFTGSLSGDARKPIDVTNGEVSLGATAASFVGSLQIQDDGIALRATGGVPLKCDSGILQTQMALVTDTRDVGKWGLGLSRACGAKSK